MRDQPTGEFWALLIPNLYSLVVSKIPIPLLAGFAFLLGCAGPVENTSASTAPVGAGRATLTFDGQTYSFTNGRCSPVLDENQFLFRDPPNSFNDATYLAIVVTDLKANITSAGGNHVGALNYQHDGKSIVSLSEDAAITIATDLKSGTFSGSDYLTKKPASGSYTC